MKDNDLIRLFLPVINSGLITLGYTNVNVVQANQPTQQGISSLPTVYYYKLFDRRYGFVKREDSWNETDEKMYHVESQMYETSFQISALVTQSPLVTNSFTASDLVNSVSAIMQSDTMIENLRIENVGVLRITDIRNPYFTDDRDRFEASPSFDFVLTHRQTTIIENPIIAGTDFGLYRV